MCLQVQGTVQIQTGHELPGVFNLYTIKKDVSYLYVIKKFPCTYILSCELSFTYTPFRPSPVHLPYI